jgi:hypothetical protein
MPSDPDNQRPDKWKSGRLVQYRDYAKAWTIQVSNPFRVKRFFSFPKRPDRLLGHPILLFNGYRCSLLRVKRTGHLSSAERSEWSCISTPPKYLNIVYRDNDL